MAASLLARGIIKWLVDSSAQVVVDEILRSSKHSFSPSQLIEERQRKRRKLNRIGFDQDVVFAHEKTESACRRHNTAITEMEYTAAQHITQPPDFQRSVTSSQSKASHYYHYDFISSPGRTPIPGTFTGPHSLDHSNHTISKNMDALETQCVGSNTPQFDIATLHQTGGPIDLFDTRALHTNSPMRQFDITTLTASDPMQLFDTTTLTANDPMQLFDITTLTAGNPMQIFNPTTVTANNSMQMLNTTTPTASDLMQIFDTTTLPASNSMQPFGMLQYISSINSFCGTDGRDYVV